ncbi:hypothetical protein HHI36_023470 [Cryptolaemus montrouzieri]|uniref:Uncharacterized protein n=1 Tax=Cryptolaemus montrouzieri TaxID=559131 RepID=A0ABD2PH22_9CUCU
MLKNHSQTNILENKSQSKALWDYVKHICKQPQTQTKINKSLNESEQLVNDEIITVEGFNHYFSKIGKQLAKRIENYEKSTNNTPVLYPTDPAEVEKTIDVIKDGKAAGYDGIKSEVL